MKKSYVDSWKNIADKATVIDVIQHCFLKAFFAQESNVVTRKEILRGQIAKSFTPVTNYEKITNGMNPFPSLKKELTKYAYTPISYLVETKLLQKSFEEAENIIFLGSRELQKEFWEFVQINALAAIKTSFQQFNKRFYTYIFVDQEDTSVIQQLIQTGHVAMVIGQEMDHRIDAHNIYFQVCKLPDGVDIVSMVNSLYENGFNVEAFYESDMDRIIAIGTHPVRSDKRKYLVKYDLLLL